MGDFLRGTLGTLAKIVLVIGGLFTGIITATLWAIIVGVIFLCMAAGVSYWLSRR
jgi:hypothetical protein